MSSDHGPRLRAQLDDLITKWRSQASALSITSKRGWHYLSWCADELDALLRASASAPPEKDQRTTPSAVVPRCDRCRFWVREGRDFGLCRMSSIDETFPDLPPVEHRDFTGRDLRAVTTRDRFGCVLWESETPAPVASASALSPEPPEELAEITAIFDEFAPLRGESKPLAQRVRDEIADFKMVIGHCSEVYDHFSGGRISKPNTLPREVIAVADELEEERIAEAIAEAKEEWQAGPVAEVPALSPREDASSPSSDSPSASRSD